MKKLYTLLIALSITSLGFGQTTIFNEGGGGSEPTGWTFQNNITTNDIDRTGYWLVDAGSPSDVITTATYDLSSYTDADFTMDIRSFNSGSHNEAKIEISFDGGSTYTQTEISNITTTTYTSIGTISLNSVSSQVVLKISNNGTSGRGVRLRDLELTASGVAPSCTSPTTQASAYNTTALTSTSATLNWTDGNGDEVLVVVKAGSAVDTDPTDGTDYTDDTIFTSGDEIGTGNYVVQSGSATSSVSITGLSPATTYHVAVYEYNTIDTCYNLTEETGSFTTTCSTPEDVTGLSATAGNATVDLSWTNGACFDDILVVAKATSAVTVTPTGDGTAYTADAAFGSGTDLGTGEYAVYKGTGTSVTVTGLTNGTTYHFEVFARKVTTWSAGVTDSALPNIPIAGWQISSEDTSFIIDFETTVSGVNEGAYDASGFTSSPASGQLDSDAWEATGLQDGSLSYGGTQTGNDFGKGTSTGGINSGGFYDFTTGGSNHTFGIQLTGGDFTPGTITLRAQNQTGTTVTAADLAYLVYVYNDQDRGNSLNFSYSTDDSSYTDVAALDITSPTTADGSPAWVSNSKSTSITGLSIADGDYLYLRWNGNDDGGSGSRDELALDDIDLTFNPAAPTTYTFAGTWSPSDPNGVSTSSEDIIIASGNATIDTNTSCNSLTVNAGASVTIDTGITLTTSNDLTLESSSTSYSSLILDGSITGTINYERHVNINGSGTTGSNDLISAPLTGQQFDDFATANPNILNNGTLYLFGHFDKTTGDYATYNGSATTTLDPGVGYRAASSDNDTFTFTGTANNGTVTNNITNSGPTEVEWNLVGNPYPSYINVQDFLNHEVDTGVKNINLFDSGTAAIYGYDGTALNGWTIYNLANTTPSTVIAPGQGFFVSADATNAPLYDLEFTPAMRSTGTTDDFIVGREAAGTFIKFVLEASTTNDSFTTDVFFNPLASLGFDFGFDTAPFAYPAFRISTSLVEYASGNPTEIGIQTINTTDLADTTIPLGVWANQGEQITFTLAENLLPVTTEVYLDDSVAGISTLLNDSDYILTPSTALSGTGRFFIRVFDETLSSVENTLDTLTISALNDTKEIMVKGQLQEHTFLSLYDIQGRKVVSTQLDHTTLANRIDTSALSSGIYVVNVKNNEQQKTQKVIIK